MSLPVHKENEEHSEEIQKAVKFLNSLIKKEFSKKDKAIIEILSSEFSSKNSTQLFDIFIPLLEQHVDLKTLNYTTIDQIDLYHLAENIKSSIEFKSFNEINKEELAEFSIKIEDFFRKILHDIIFPMLSLESPNTAESAKNLIKRTINSLQKDNDVDLSKTYEKLGIEDLPTFFNEDSLRRFGGKTPIDGLIENYESETEKDTIIYCELSPEQVIVLCYLLESEHEVIKNWKSLSNLFRSKGKRYGNVIVNPNKIGLLLSIIDLLYKRKNIAKEKYISLNNGNSIWTFLQGYLINAKTDQPFKRELRKLKSEKKNEKEAIQIIDYLFDDSKQEQIKERAKEIKK